MPADLTDACDAREIGEEACTCRRCLMGQVDALRRQRDEAREAIRFTLGVMDRYRAPEKERGAPLSLIIDRSRAEAMLRAALAGTDEGKGT